MNAIFFSLEILSVDKLIISKLKSFDSQTALIGYQKQIEDIDLLLGSLKEGMNDFFETSFKIEYFLNLLNIY